ncbi:MAG TPA: 3'(2'),5'-bisphosphate nucleotidase [Saprospirales bacterium]|nr:3'(2'),5'-bisphosphate nucleotidase [Saprospirales bacterium]HRQ29730.1 3'(2'),5'-bisphosphate nucleotidase CysQ [Saprospiraceae bacterium]
MPEDASNILSVVTRAGLEAGNAIMDIYSFDFEHTIQIKKDATPVTMADKKASDIITFHLSGLIEDCPVITEESDIPNFKIRQKLHRYWLVDPLDGTKEFIQRNGDFTVNIALIEQGKPVFGWVSEPVTGRYYYAFKSKGAYCQANGDIKPIHCSPFSPNQKNLRILRSRSHFSAKADEYISQFNSPVIIARGSSIKMMLIASGQADIYPCLSRTMEWDTAASQIILEEAGGELTGMYTGLPLEYNKKELSNPFFIATGKKN